MKNFSAIKSFGIIKKIFKNKFILFSFLIALFLNVTIWILFFIFIKPSADPIMLHYNIYFGIDLIGEWYKIYLIPLSGLAIILINFLFSAIMYTKKKVLSYLAIGFTATLQLLLGLAAILIIQINI